LADLATSRTSSLTWMRVGVVSARRARRSKLRTMRAARSTSRTIVDAAELASGSRVERPSSSASMRMAASGLFTSCATPARDLADGGELFAGDELALRAQLVGAIVQGDEQVLRPQAPQAGDVQSQMRRRPTPG